MAIQDIDRRARFRKGLFEQYLPFYDSLCGILPLQWQPFQGLRTLEEQAELYAKGRDAPGVIVTNAPPGMTPHNWGCATDWTIFQQGFPVWEHGQWNEYRDALEKVGLVWGGSWGTLLDRPHNQLSISVPYKSLYTVYKVSGFDAVYSKIRECSGLI